MDDEYICEHLKKLIGLMVRGEPFAFTLEPGYKYHFGTMLRGKTYVRNVVTKPIAMYLCIGAWKYEKEKKQYKRKRKVKK
jgi:hypothetical protein